MADPGKHWSPKGGGRPSYTRAEMDEAENDSPLAVCRHHNRGIRVEIEYIGESLLGGGFDPDDPADTPVVRFRVFDGTREDGDEEYASYATQIPATMPIAMLESFACALTERLADEESWKHLLQEWSWTGEKDVRRIHKKRAKRGK